MAEPWSPEAELAALRAAGLDRADPVRFAYLQALARRLPAQPARAQALLAERLQQAAAALRAASTQHGAQAPVPAPAQAGALAGLLARLTPPPSAQAAPAAAAAAVPGRAPAATPAVSATAAPAELKSVRHFRQAWKRLNAEQRLAQSRAALPQNAGPLNSQHLVHKALQQMRQLSPACFERFVAQVDGLMWLEQALGEAAPREPAGSSRPRR
ncbi:DUF2894 domain-containing protein [Ideonella dechloratans]|uniref:DUF2894 domain-containing protein n=2 Tax=Ideonella dechloratans TaxID=36863 RepID=UPI001E3CBA44|nr:DUF2894 domain-containing protein [Ideonella dechloratans]UFU11468.1 DUF2894 domain-containing protein [Ideonella dechloratans]